MKTKVLIWLSIIFLSFSVNAYTKQDIINYATSQEVCDAKTSVIFNTYKNTFTRLLKQKSLTGNQCAQIMEYLVQSVGILNKKGVCSLSDLSKLTPSEKNTIYSNLSAGANMIIKAPTIGFEKDNNSDNTVTTDGTSGININKTDGTIDVYENGMLIDKVQINQEKLTYTGPSRINVYILVISFIFLITLIIYIVIYSKHTRKLRFLKNILMSVQIMSGLTVLTLLVIKPKVYTVSNLMDMLSLKTTDNVKSLTITEEKEIIYPSFGYVYGKLLIANLNINVDVAFGDTEDILTNALGTASWSSLPTENKNIVISGHNYKEILGNIENIKIGEEIILDTDYATCVYTVYDIKVINDTDIDKVKVSRDKESLVVYTCFPFSQYIYSNQRFAVYSELKNIEWK